jgi:hypothetical protein
MANEENTVRVEAAVLSAAEIEQAWRGEVCAACGKFKRAGAAFCASDFAALALPMRWNLTGPQAHDAFRAAARHLQLHRERRVAIAESGWSFRSQDELEAAGYRGTALHLRCNVPRPDSERVPPHTCGAWISIWKTPQGGRIALDDRTYRPHRPDCVDPGYFERKREAKRLQKPNRRARRRG